MLNLSSLSTQSLASCVNYFVWNCLTCFSNTKIGSVTSFSILFNFQGPVAPQPSGWQLNYFTTEVVFCQALFFRSFSFLTELGASRKSLAFLPDFLASIGSFRFTSSWDSEVILLSQRLALKYNTTSPPGCQHFFTSFFKFFRADWNRLHLLVFFRQRLFVCYNVLYKGQSIDNDLYYAKESPRFPCTNCQEVPSQILFRKFSVIFGESYKTQNVVVLPLTYH